jgi:UDP-glucose 4-epimerase
VKDWTLVTGGAGYVGAHAVRRLRADGRSVMVLDDLSSGHRGAVAADVELVVGSLADRALVAELFAGRRIAAIMHFAARSIVGQSMREPMPFLRDNVVEFLNLVEVALAHGAPPLVLSSTASVYGPAGDAPIDEDHPLGPSNPYGAGKAYAEAILEQLGRTHGFRSMALRYFNAAGADPEGGIGEDHRPETHLIPRLLAVALGQDTALSLFGDDYPTRDGTAVRDYVHVCDLADAHVRALDHLLRGGASGRLNLGSGVGFTVAEVLAAAREVTGHAIPATIAPRRAGDPAVLVASRSRAEAVLDWRPRRSDLATILADAWHWHRGHPRGYATGS